jgi:hypothetical protein
MWTQHLQINTLYKNHSFYPHEVIQKTITTYRFTLILFILELFHHISYQINVDQMSLVNFDNTHLG